MRMRFLVAAFLVATAFTVAPIGVRAAPSQIVVFGDSLSDTGNVFAASGGVTPVPEYFNGRFSNGPNWVERLAGAFGLPVVPSALGGTNNAFGGATTGGSGGSVPSLLDQFAGYSAAHASADASALYVVWGGGNDMRDALLAPATIPTAITAAVANLQSILTGLNAKGAQRFLVPNLPNLGLIPEVSALGAAAVAGATSTSAGFNASLAAMLAGLAADPTFTGEIVPLDVFGILNNIVANPAAFGLTNVVDQCYSLDPQTTGGTICASPDNYLFWDGIHPTARGHFILGNFAIQAVPEPATILIFVIGLLGLAMAARRTAARV